VHTGDSWNHRQTIAYYFDDRKNAPFNPKCDIRLKQAMYPFWKRPEDRFDQLGLWAISILVANRVNKAYIEDYAFSRGGASGRVFDLAENGGVLKNYMMHFNVPFVLVSPSDLKKWVTDNGAAKKDLMEAAFVADTGITDLRTVLNLTEKASTPISDIIDAYYLANYAFVDMTTGIDGKKQKTRKLGWNNKLKKIKPLPKKVKPDGK
jgi:hypothetical protein